MAVEIGEHVDALEREGIAFACAAEKAGLDYYGFVERLVDVAMARYERA